MKPLAFELENLTTGSGQNTITGKVKLLKLKPKSMRKADLIVALADALSNPQVILKIWKGLCDYERALLEVMVRRDNAIDRQDIIKIFKKFCKPEPGYYYHLTDFFDKNSLAHVLLVGRVIPEQVLEILKTIVKPAAIQFQIWDTPKLGKYDQILEIRETFEQDFLNLISLINTGKLKTTKVGGLPTKAAMQKINSVLHTPEHALYSGFTEARTIEGTTRLFPLYNLLSAAGIIAIENGLLTLMYAGTEFIEADLAQKCRMLLDGYRNEDLELEFMGTSAEKTRAFAASGSLQKPREYILLHLKMCPLDQWIAVEQFTHVIKSNMRRLLPNTFELETYRDYESYWYPTEDWDSRDKRFIEVALMGYLSALGIVDVVSSLRFNDYDHYYHQPKFIRLTPLGAHVLGINKSYQVPSLGPANSGIVIQPNFEIIVSEGQTKMTHILYLDTFAEKSSTGTVPIYRLTFKSIIKAIDEGIELQEIKDYFQEYSEHPVPDTIMATLTEWEAKSKKIKIRTVTILETDDPYLLEELKSYKTIQKYLKQDLPHAVEIEAKAATRVKRECEKKNHICLVE